MKRLLFLMSLLFITAQVHAQTTSLGDVLVTSVDNIVYVQSPTGLQAAINTVCAAGGGTVMLPTIPPMITTINGQTTVTLQPYEQDTSLVLCSNLNIIGAGRSETVTSCPTLIQTTLTSGDLFPISGMTDIHISDLCIAHGQYNNYNVPSGVYTPPISNTCENQNGPYVESGQPNAVFRLNTGQFVTIERVTIFASCVVNSTVGFQVGLELNVQAAVASTIYNHFSDISMWNLRQNGVGCLLYANNSSSSSNRINNNYFDNVNCIGGYGPSGAGLQVTGGNGSPGVIPDINENVFHGGQFGTQAGASKTEYGVIVGSNSSQDLTMIGADIESNTYGLHLAAGNDGFSCYGCKIASNTVGDNIYVADGSTRTAITGNIGDLPAGQQYSLDQTGNMVVNSLSLSAPTTSAAASSGSASSLPGLPAGYLTGNIGGVNYKIPYYNQ